MEDYNLSKEATQIDNVLNKAILEGDSRLSDARAPLGHTHTKSDISDFTHTHAISEVSYLKETIENKADKTHTHSIGDVTDFFESTSLSFQGFKDLEEIVEGISTGVSPTPENIYYDNNHVCFVLEVEDASAESGYSYYASWNGSSLYNDIVQGNVPPTVACAGKVFYCLDDGYAYTSISYELMKVALDVDVQELANRIAAIESKMGCYGIATSASPSLPTTSSTINIKCSASTSSVTAVGSVIGRVMVDLQTYDLIVTDYGSTITAEATVGSSKLTLNGLNTSGANVSITNSSNLQIASIYIKP